MRRCTVGFLDQKSPQPKIIAYICMGYEWLQGCAN
jgi:hypothetical protein